MHSRRFLFVALLVAGSLALPFAAQAGGIPFFGPIVPDAINRCAAGWGMLITVINNIISFLITLAIVFVAPLMIAWSGFLFVVNPVNAGGKEQARKILTNTVVGIVIALAGWLIVDAIMAVLYNPSARSGETVLTTWSNLVTSGGALPCIPLKASLNQVPGLVPSVDIAGISSNFTFDSGIDAQISTASGPLSALLSCMVSRVPAGVGRISSISDSKITSGQQTFSSCRTNGSPTCAHTRNSCHYGGTSCGDSSYAVDFGDEENTSILTAAAQACGAKTLNEGNHLHVSVGATSGCDCDTRL